VVKIGGSTLSRLDGAWWDDAATLARGGSLVCVHGWSRQLAAYQRGRGRRPEFAIDQHGHRSRLTDAAALADIRVVAGGLRAEIGGRLGRRRVRVATCCGDADGLLLAESRSLLWWRDGRLVPLTNLVGPVRRVETERLRARLRGHEALVVTPLARDSRHGTVNTDGDRAAARVAAAIGAERLVLATDVTHVISAGEPLETLRRRDIEDLARQVGGGMRKKLRAAGEALEGGVQRVHIGAGRPSVLLAGAGTTVIP